MVSPAFLTVGGEGRPGTNLLTTAVHLVLPPANQHRTHHLTSSLALEASAFVLLRNVLSPCYFGPGTGPWARPEDWSVPMLPTDLRPSEPQHGALLRGSIPTSPPASPNAPARSALCLARAS